MTTPNPNMSVTERVIAMQQSCVAPLLAGIKDVNAERHLTVDFEHGARDALGLVAFHAYIYLFTLAASDEAACAAMSRGEDGIAVIAPSIRSLELFSDPDVVDGRRYFAIDETTVEFVGS